MKKNQTENYPAGISDEAVAEKTGKTWEEWFVILDAAGAANMDHKGIVAVLSDQYQVSSWWRQMLTVGYEQARGLRQKHEKPDGYEVSVSKTINVPLAVLFNAWGNEKERARWFPRRKITVRKATSNKSLRLTWEGDKSSVDINFYSKGDEKSQVTCQHHKLPNQEDVGLMREFWAKTLQSLKERLENNAQ
ncbi:MAG TPA: hypothetical protein VJ810_19310 [Blastocatellia bacterium]|nr:hypothetical protein [Blastocatellia bacterium]